MLQVAAVADVSYVAGCRCCRLQVFSAGHSADPQLARLMRKIAADYVERTYFTIWYIHF